jgi:hypothetical protein
MNTLNKAIRLALAGGCLALVAAADAEAALTMYNTFTTTDQNATDGWTRVSGSANSGALQPWVGVANRPFNFRGPSALNWAIELNGPGDSGVISTADSVARYAFAAEIDTAQGAWQDESAAKTGWRHQTDFGIIRSDTTQTVQLSAEVVGNAFPSLFGISLYEGMDNRLGGGWSHHGGWNAGYVAGDTSAANLARVNANNAMDITGLRFLDFIDSSGLGPHGGNVLEFTAEAGQIYTVLLGGRAGGSWNGVKAGYALTVSAAPVPVPAAAWLFASAVAGIGWAGRRKTAAGNLAAA